MKCIDLNCDMGELPGAIADGTQEALMPSITSVNIACGGHAGDARWDPDVVLVGLAGSPMLNVFREAGFTVAAEAFADRRYEPDGTLRSRKFADALIRNPEEAGRQALSIVERGTLVARGGAEI